MKISGTGFCSILCMEYAQNRAFFDVKILSPVAQNAPKSGTEKWSKSGVSGQDPICIEKHYFLTPFSSSLSGKN